MERKIVDLDKETLAGRRFDVQKMADLIDEGYKKQGREPSDIAKKSFAPSNLGYGSGKCPRQWYYSFTGGVIREDSADAVGIANMAYGTEAHARLQKVFEDAGILVEAERPITTGTFEEGEDRPTFNDEDEFPPMYGFADLIINWQGEEVVGEIKTTMQESYVSKKAKSTAAGYHLLQVLIYMRVLGLNKGFIIYENKNTQKLLLVPVTWNVANNKLADDAFAFMRATYKNWQEGYLPERPFKSEKSVVCKTCPFQKHCWEDETEALVKLPVLEVPA